ncbi:Protein HOS4 [Tolypocladium ophioglossoides CBS 100239]|uniref:Protein HOS4 n=1 Tax=Tolypocladium ophioglossoides (strain CBS 100239) TaxID=1163406 RepID=A0A0L0NMC5_TOLOC|nr:Protein HOS4 [Tolypocladium ophioglossoides CBS 100239]
MAGVAVSAQNCASRRPGPPEPPLARPISRRRSDFCLCTLRRDPVFSLLPPPCPVLSPKAAFWTSTCSQSSIRSRSRLPRAASTPDRRRAASQRHGALHDSARPAQPLIRQPPSDFLAGSSRGAALHPPDPGWVACGHRPLLDEPDQSPTLGLSPLASRLVPVPVPRLPRFSRRPHLRRRLAFHLQDGGSRLLLSQINDMDAQNAAESDQTRPAGASPPRRRSGSDPDSNKPTSPTSLSASSPARDAKAKGSAAADDASSTVRPDDSSPEDRESDAETIVLPGKDGHSPSKARKVRQEDKSESDGEAAKAKAKFKSDEHAVGNGNGSNDGDKSASAGGGGGAPGNHPCDGAKKNRLSASASGSCSADKDRRPRNKEGGSSGLSSAPASPPHIQQHLQNHRRRRSDAAPSSPSDSEQHSHHKASSKTSLRDKLKSAERLLPHKRKAPKAESDDEADIRKARRQRTASISLDGGRPFKEARSTPVKSQHDTRTRSISPHPRQHRRSISTQLPSQASNGLNPKKKRLPPPLHPPTDYQSDDSSTGGSPHPRSSKLRSLATPGTAESNVSPAKMAPHKKHLDAHGQTLLARACARGEYDVAKQRLGERPEDLNVADYAGNTPLQIAAINGCEDIVKLLIDAGCNLDCVNYDKDTPLLDAVDNGHLGVVKLLLDAGVNPRKANVNGEEPLDRVSEDTDNADEIRAALSTARKRAGDRQRTSEDRHSHHDYHDVRDSHAPDSPRHSPAATASAATGRRSGNVRSTKTRNDLLYMPLDDKTLRQAAGRGDEETVARILQVKEGYDDPESMVAAARGGHDLVIQLLLGLGGANADPGPVSSLPSEFATPILAAIGQENIKVIELLLEQQGFDPTRRFKGETYYEIARRRQGTNWKDEEQLLKNAYDEYKRSHKDATKTKSPGGRRERERGREDKLSRRDEAKESARSHKRNHSSPSREGEVKRKGAAFKLASPGDKRRSNSFTNRGDDESQKRGPGRVKKDVSNISDREISPALSHKPHMSKRTESDVTAMSSEGETAKPRRKLVSKGELSRERDKQKRSLKEPSSPHESRSDDAPEKSRLSEKYHDRTKALKRDESRDHKSGDGAMKRHRSSVTPDRPSDADKDQSEGPVKRRRLDGENLEKRHKRPVSVDGRPRKSGSSREGSAKPSIGANKKEREDGSKGGQDQRASQHHSYARNGGGEKSIHVKSEDVDVPMLDIEQPEDTDGLDSSKAAQDHDEQMKRKRELVAEEAKKDEERKRKKREEEEARKRQEQADRERREAEEAARRLDEEKKRLEEKRKKEEEEQRQREEEERLHREQLEREAAEEARKQREEEERKERERRERAHREEVERKRAAREAEQRRIREEQERARLDKLPPLLRWLDTFPNPKNPGVAERFKRVLGFRYDTIRQEANGTPEGREQWVLNTDVALLLGEKDLDLSRYTAWERAPVSKLAKLTIWRTEGPRYALTSHLLWDLGRQLPGYYGVEDPATLGVGAREQLNKAAWERFLTTDMFFVKCLCHTDATSQVSDLLYTVPNIPHLSSIKLAVEYRELLESESQTGGWASASKWKQDPDAGRFFGHAPRCKYYISGIMVGEDMPTLHQTSRTPFPEIRVPRRGLVQVNRDDPDYERICMEQGLEHLLKGRQTPSLPNGVHSSPSSQTTTTTPPVKSLVNGTNGHSTHEPAHAFKATNGVALNGINGS